RPVWLPRTGHHDFSHHDLLAFVLLDRLLDLTFYCIKVEGRRRLHRRKVDGRLRKLEHRLLHHHEAPELARHEVIHIAPAHVVQTFATKIRGPLERILTQVHDARHVGRDLLSRPTPGLLDELELKVVDPDRPKVRSPEVENLMTLGGTLAGQNVHLVIAI